MKIGAGGERRIPAPRKLNRPIVSVVAALSKRNDSPDLDLMYLVTFVIRVDMCQRHVLC